MIEEESLLKIQSRLERQKEKISPSYFRQTRLLSSFDIYNETGPTTRRGSLAVKYYSRWKPDHLPDNFILLRTVLTKDFSSVCHLHQLSAMQCCQQMKEYFSNNCDETCLMELE